MHHASCQCGNLFISARSDPDFVIACNCKLCQRRSGSPFGAAGYFLKSDLTFTGTPKTWSRKAESGRNLTNHFCETCGTTLYIALASLVNVGVGVDSLEHCMWPSLDGLPHGAQRLVGEALHATALALTPSPMRRDSV